MKKQKIIFWSATIFIFLFEGLMPGLTGHTEMAKEGIRHLGYPEYFGTVFVVFKVIGAFILIIPAIPARLKEWAYAGFSFDFAFAFISIWVVDGFGVPVLLPLVVWAILMLSYISYHKLRKRVNKTA